ncbi:mitofilin family membrane protein [Parasphingorhabdus sp.]|uniref:mitofilin family membrane protein n=1 Tax=Parasphingorhabdus sp. TaxID=2709688 RepID=UPI002F953399
MSRDYEKTTSADGKSNLMRNILILMVVAFVGGVILTGWIFSRYNPFENGPFGSSSETAAPAAGNSSSVTDPATALAKRVRADGTVAAPPPVEPVPTEIPTLTPDKERALAVRVADLEDRLSRINVQAQAASGNAARAEGLLIAFAARRALDRGSPLGYLEAQIRLRFGDAQPRAVTTIVNGSRQPVTLDELLAELNDISPTLTSGWAGTDFWTDFKRELSELFVIRREGSPSPVPQKRMERARRYIENGNVEAAIAEIEKLPGSDSGDEMVGKWMEKARRYNEVRRALDIIETAAILEPQRLSAVANTRQGVEPAQTVPVSPTPAP